MNDLDRGIYDQQPDTLQQRLTNLNAALTGEVAAYYLHHQLSEGLPSGVAQAQRDGKGWAHIVQYAEINLAQPDDAEAFRALGASLGIWDEEEVDLAREGHATIPFVAPPVAESELYSQLSGEVPFIVHYEQANRTGLVLPTGISDVWLELQSEGADPTTNDIARQSVKPMLYVYVGEG